MIKPHVLKSFCKLNVLLNSFFLIDRNKSNNSFVFLSTVAYYTDISCLGGVFAKNTSRETKNFGERNLVSGLVFFANTPPKHAISV